MNSELRNKINTIASKTPSKWLEKAMWRRKNDWWLMPWKRIQLKYYRLKRKLKNLYK